MENATYYIRIHDTNYNKGLTAINENKMEKIEQIAQKIVSSQQCAKMILGFPKVFKDGEYIFRFVSADVKEALHVDVFGNDGWAKFWVKDEKYGLKNKPESLWSNDSHLAKNEGLKPEEITKIKKTIQDRRDEIVQKWEHAIEEAKRSGKQ